MGWALITLTFALVAVGAVLYDGGSIGWAQLFFVIASGTAGAGVMSLFDERRMDRERQDFWDEN